MAKSPPMTSPSFVSSLSHCLALAPRKKMVEMAIHFYLSNFFRCLERLWKLWIFCVLIFRYFPPYNLFINFIIIVFLVSGFANELSTARAAGSFKRFMVGRSSEATFAESFEKQEAIIRYLGRFDPTGDVSFWFFNLIDSFFSSIFLQVIRWCCSNFWG